MHPERKRVRTLHWHDGKKIDRVACFSDLHRGRKPRQAPPTIAILIPLLAMI